jgi:hypothetical protein
MPGSATGNTMTLLPPNSDVQCGSLARLVLGLLHIREYAMGRITRP